jgi:MYXO-CTERM domain-containing protein
MRLLAPVLAAAVLAATPATGLAAPPPMRIGGFQGVRHVTRAEAAAGFSNVIYMNDCLPDGCTVHPGNDDSRTDSSSIPFQTSHLPGYPWGQASWDDLVQCMRETYAQFDVQIVTDDPGTTPHFELMVGGNSTDIGVDGALGVAPFIPCGGVIDNVITFVFAAEDQSIDDLCWAAAQETSHAFGLDHELNAQDPMTYLYPPYHKDFQDADASCGESTPRECWCGGPTQNSARFLAQLFGLATPVPPEITITEPADGAWVKPGFHVHAQITSLLAVSAGLEVDGAASGGAVAAAPYTFTAPDLGAGDHTIAVTATDSNDMTARGEVTVHQMATCGAGCADGTVCLGGLCVPDASTPGGLGAACGATPCATGTCGSDGTDSKCTGACDAGDVCPDGYACLGPSGQGVCWPDAGGGGGGGCAVDGGGAGAGAGWLVLVGLIVVPVFRRRRRA